MKTDDRYVIKLLLIAIGGVILGILIRILVLL